MRNTFSVSLLLYSIVCCLCRGACPFKFSGLAFLDYFFVAWAFFYCVNCFISNPRYCGQSWRALTPPNSACALRLPLFFARLLELLSSILYVLSKKQEEPWAYATFQICHELCINAKFTPALKRRPRLNVGRHECTGWLGFLLVFEKYFQC